MSGIEKRSERLTIVNVLTMAQVRNGFPQGRQSRIKYSQAHSPPIAKAVFVLQ